ncbi:hypothetical protein RZO55_23665, partial [Clostridium boliviensis]
RKGLRYRFGLPLLITRREKASTHDSALVPASALANRTRPDAPAGVSAMPCLFLDQQGSNQKACTRPIKPPAPRGEPYHPIFKQQVSVKDRRASP